MTNGEKHYKALFESKGYSIIKGDSSNKTKAPDFCLYKENTLFAYCEVKDIEDLAHSYFTTNAPFPDEVSKFFSLIYHAIKQLTAVNQTHSVPNILAIYCDRIGMDAWDLFSALNGYVPYEDFNNYRNGISDAERRIKQDKFLIDIYIFFKRSDDVNQQGFYPLYNSTFFSWEYLNSLELLKGEKICGSSELLY